MDRIVLVDDEVEILNIQREALEGMDFSIQTFADPRACWEYLQNESDVSLVVTDWNMPGMTGMDLLFNIRGLPKPPYVILQTAFGTVERAVKAMNLGAFDFVEKPFDVERFRKAVNSALQAFRNRPLVERKSTKSAVPTVRGPVVESAAMKAVYETAQSAASTDSSILLLGESGTGKEVLAEYIHQKSRRASAPMIKVNCAALPEHLMESELFGHEKGAFTGADKRNIGRFEQASGGTLFLDEIGDLPLPVQVKLLRALQERVIERVGAGAVVKVDFRLICATHQNLKAAIASGKFREDLYYRINVVPIRLPALRDRQDEVRTLAEHFITKLSASVRSGPRKFSEEALSSLCAYSWPGNVRQLRNAVEYALVLGKGEIINPGDLPEEVRSASSATLPAVAAANSNLPMIDSTTSIASSTVAASPAGLRGSVKEAEAELIRSTLEKNHWHMSKVAKELQISRSTLYQRLKTYGIKPP